MKYVFRLNALKCIHDDIHMRTNVQEKCTNLSVNYFPYYSTFAYCNSVDNKFVSYSKLPVLKPGNPAILTEVYPWFLLNNTKLKRRDHIRNLTLANFLLSSCPLFYPNLNLLDCFLYRMNVALIKSNTVQIYKRTIHNVATNMFHVLLYLLLSQKQNRFLNNNKNFRYKTCPGSIFIIYYVYLLRFVLI